MERIQAISFDGDGTLWDYERSMKYALGHVLSELRALRPLDAKDLTVELMIESREAVSRTLAGASLEGIRLEAFRETLRRLELREDSLALWMNHTYRSYRAEGIVLFDDVLPVLGRLKGKYRLGLLSNGNTDPVSCGLGQFLDFAVFAHEYGVEKPDPTLFHVAAGKAGCTEEAILHVGDSIGDDVAGARTAGMVPIWLNRQGTEPGCGKEIEWEIESLWGLLEILR